VHEVSDPEPHAAGKFGLRTFRTDAWWDDVEIARVISVDPDSVAETSASDKGETLSLTFEGASRHPTVQIGPDDVAHARAQIKNDPEVRDWLASVGRNAAPWRDKTPEWVHSVLPEPGAAYAMGYVGCPICGSSWHTGNWLRMRASFDNPGQVICDQGHALPDEQHPDPGTGYVGPDGRTHYFQGSYNTYVIEILSYSMAEPFSFLYLLGGDDDAGRMGAVILDELARIYPSSTKGAWDYPSPKPHGRLNRPNYQTSRALVRYIDMYDRLHGHPAMDEPSSVPGLTRRENIERNLILNGGNYCYEQALKMGGLHNGQADYVRGALATGVILGIPEYVKWAADGPSGIRTMLANNIDRDGRYFESSAGYALHTRNLYLTFTEPLFHYRGSAFPEGLNLYDDPAMQAFLLLPDGAMSCLGYRPTFGDIIPTTTQTTGTAGIASPEDIYFAEILSRRVTDPARRDEYRSLLAHLVSTRPDGRSGRVTPWRTFHGLERPVTDTQALDVRYRRILDGSHFVGQKGVAVLRQGNGDAAQAAILRFGPSLVHGHFDDLNINYYARDWELTYDLGYKLGSTHTQQGFAKQTVSHNTVVVDEKSHGGGMFGGSLLHFTSAPGLALAEGSSMVYAHTGVSDYRRLFALAPEYALDLFRVRGGKQHDLPLHSMSEEVDFEHVTFGPPQDGSLAGPDYRWGNLQLDDGDMEGHPNRPYWNPPPGNGYGFLMAPEWADPQSSWSATWKWTDAASTRFAVLALDEGGTSVVSALAPGIRPEFPKARHVIRRRAGDDLESAFASVWQSWNNETSAPVRAAWRLDRDDRSSTSSTGSVAVAVELTDGQLDYWLLGNTPDTEQRVRHDACSLV
ncbi:MAG: heparinase II/III family protein, partial [Gemmatimonadetes bacterium]|nr:heparinase II/III family protein [Gemmatimonadota bacterium]